MFEPIENTMEPVPALDAEAMELTDATATAAEMGIDTADEAMMSALLDAITEGIA